MSILNTEDISCLQSALANSYPDAICQNGYVELLANNQKVIAWFDQHAQALPTLRLRIVLVRLTALKALTDDCRKNLTANLNAAFQFGRFNAESPIGLLLDYEIPFIGQLDSELVVSAIERLAMFANAAQESYVERALEKAMKPNSSQQE